MHGDLLIKEKRQSIAKGTGALVRRQKVEGRREKIDWTMFQ
jgi:hypothetical protein